MIAAYTQVLQKYIAFAGRAPRSEFWWFMLVQGIIGVVASVLSGVVSDSIGLLWTLYFLVTVIPSIAVSIRRLHDTGRSAWWLAMGAVPATFAIILVMGGIYLLALGCLVGFLVGFIEVFTGGSDAAEFWGLCWLGYLSVVFGLLLIIPSSILAIVLVVLLALPSDTGGNKYGPQPR